MIIDELIAILGYDVKGEGELRRFNDGLDRAQRRAEVVANRINAMSVAIGSFVGTIAAHGVMRLGTMIGSLPGDVIEVGKTFEALEIRLNTLEGSSEKAEKAMAWIRQFAKDTPLELAQVADAYADLKNFGLDPTNGSLQALTDAMSASGKGTAMLGRLTLAIGQAWVKQKLQGQEILQLTEAGIPVWDMLAEATGKNVQELQKLSSAGKLGRKEIQLLIDAIQNKYVGASEKFAKSFEGITSKLSDEWTEFLALIGEKGFYDDAKRRLEGVFDTIRKWDKEGLLDKAATSISGFFTGSLQYADRIGLMIWDIGKAAYYTADGIVELISRVTGLNKAASAGIFGAALLGSSALGRAAMLALARRIPQLAALLLVEDIMGALRGDKSYVGTLEGGQEAIEKVRESWQGLADAAGSLAESLSGVFAFDWKGFSWGGFVNKEIVRFVGDLAALFKELEGYVSRYRQTVEQLRGIWNSDDGFLSKIDQTVDALVSHSVDFVGKLIGVEGLSEKLDELERELFAWVASVNLFDAGAQMMSSLLEGMKSIGASIRDWFSSLIPEWARGWVVNTGASGTEDTASTDPSRMHERFATSPKGTRVHSRGPNPDRFGGKEEVFPQATGIDQLRAMLENMNANLAKMTPERTVQATVTDARQDNRQFPVTVNTTVNQTVQQATQAPAAAAQATGNAVGQAAAQRANRVEISPAF